jgi:hypothetical protein
MRKNHLRKPFLLIAATLALSLVGCISENDIPNPNPPEDGERRMYIRIVEHTETRAVSPEQIPPPHITAPVRFNRGDLYFVNIFGNIMHHFRIGDFGGTSNPENGEIDVEQLRTTGVPIPSLHGSVRRAYVVGNTQNNPADGNISAVGSQVLYIISQHNADDVNLWGSAGYSEWDYAGTIDGRRGYEITVDIQPTVARLEISDIRAEGRITSFVLEGIFIDFYHEQAQVRGTLIGNPLTRGDVPDNFRGGAGNAFYHDTHFAIHDWYPIPIISDNLIVRPYPTTAPDGRRMVWGYQVFADSEERNATGSQVPRIIVRFSSITLDDGTVWDTRFLTVRGFTNVETGDPIEGFHARNVYHIRPGHFVFTEDNLTYRPNQQSIDVQVTINTAHWIDRPIVFPGLRQPNPIGEPIACNTQHDFILNPAFCGDCVIGTITYEWQQSLDGGRTWTLATNANPLPPLNLNLRNNNQNFRTPHLNSSVYYRRMATCSCGNNAPIYTMPARLSLPCRRPASDFPIYVNINGTRLSTRNVDLSQTQNIPSRGLFAGFAEHPADAGMKFQLGRNVGWSATNAPPLRSWCVDEERWKSTAERAWDPTWLPAANPFNDPCRLVGDGNWRTPTPAQLLNFARAGGFTWHTLDEASEAGFGCQLGGTNGSYFFPAFGYRLDSNGSVRVPHQAMFWTNNVSARQRLQVTPAAENGLLIGTPHANALSVRCVRVD